MNTSTTTLTHSTHCVKAATKILGDKWTPLIISALAQESLRFCQLQTYVGGINPRTLSARLGELETQRIISKQSRDNSHIYVLEQRGHDLLPIVQSMEAWGDKYATA